MKTRSLATGLLLAGSLALGACSQAAAGPSAGPASSEPATTAGATDPTSTPATPGGTAAPAPVVTSTNAQAKGPLTVYADADDKARVVTNLKATTSFGSRTTLLVTDQRDGYVQVSLPTRPNGSTGWVKADAVSLRANDVSIHVDLASHTAKVVKGREVVAETPVATGTDANPTPKGTFYVTDLVQNRNPKDAYGPFALGLSAHSDTLSEFGGGDGQVALHGTNDPSSIGRSVSHGCVRLPNDVIGVLAQGTPLGTPVTIV
jgi:lipoprotein-anchoring transpeptidase ErfK/SrfK